MAVEITHKTKFSSQLIYEQLRQQILDFEYYPGARVTESELAQHFDVSRTPVRAALQRLEVEGLVHVLPKQGCFIRSVDINRVSEYYDVRIMLEAAAVELACDNMSPTALLALAEYWNPSHCDRAGNLEVLKAEEEAFHISIAVGSGNTVLANYLKDINNHIRIIRRLGFPDHQSVMDTYIEHAKLIELIQQRAKVEAKNYMIQHIKKSQELARSVTLYQLQNARHNDNNHTNYPF